MSRSYKLAIYKDRATKRDKRFASKAVRRYKGMIPDGSSYKKLYCSWNIHDFIIDCSHYKLEDTWWDNNCFEKNDRIHIHIWK